MSGLGKERREARDERLLDVFYETVEHVPGGQSIAESYVDHGAELHVHFGLRRSETETGQLCAVFERPERMSEFLVRDTGVNPLGPHRERGDRDDVPVLVDAVELSDHPQRFVGRYLSVVRLRPLDLCLCGWGGEAYGTRVVALRLLGDGEADASPVGFGEHLYGVAREVPGDRVERRHEVVR